MAKQLPHQIIKYFWGDNLSSLSWEKHKQFILQTLLEKGDQEAIAWLFNRAKKAEIKSMLPSLKLSKKSAGFWNFYLS